MKCDIEISIGSHVKRLAGSWDYRPDLTGMHPCDELLAIIRDLVPAAVLLARGYASEISDKEERYEAVRAAAATVAEVVSLREVAREADGNEFRVRGDILECGVKVGEFYAAGHVRNWTRVELERMGVVRQAKDEPAAGDVRVTVPYLFDCQEYSYQVDLTPERAKEALARAAKELHAEYDEEEGEWRYLDDNGYLCGVTEEGMVTLGAGLMDWGRGVSYSLWCQYHGYIVAETKEVLLMQTKN